MNEGSTVLTVKILNSKISKASRFGVLKERERWTVFL